MSEEKVTLTFRTDVETRDALDKIAKSMDRDRSYVVKEAVAQYLTTQEWQVEHIKKGLEQAKAGIFVPDEEVEAFFNEWADAED
jgi:predicted transcriptional regulator